jgi:hypothetical protein
MTPGAFPEKLFQPGTLNEVVGLALDSVENNVSLMYNRRPMNQLTIYDQMMSGPGEFTEWDDLQDFTYDGIAAEWEIEYTSKDYKQGLIFSRRAERHLKYRTAEEAVGDLAIMAKVTQERQGVALFEDNATFPGDGLAFFHTAHLLSPKLAASQTHANLIEADVNVDTLRQLIALCESQPWLNGVVGRFKPMRIWTHRDRYDEVIEYLKSSARVDAQHAGVMNTFERHQLDVRINPEFTDPDPVYLQANRTFTKWFDDVDITVDPMFRDPENHAAKTQAYYAAVNGLTWWAGWYKLTGSAT